ncbi:MAG: LysR family transcriptional regulator [Peptococcaceae bacterium]|nr:LysR family transcriptional regulator [Peptococcaceae bacterium]
MLDGKIQTLLALAKVGSYTKTAKILSLTQPAVSHQMRQLEAEYGIRIFYPGRKELKPTPEGEILIKYAKRMLALDENVRQEINNAKKHLRRISVGITTTLGEYLVMQIFADYCRIHPDVTINIINDGIENIYGMLSLFQIDLAIVEGKIQREDYVSVLLDTDYLCLVVSPRHPFARRGSIGLEELKREKFILRSSTAGTRKLFEAQLLKQGKRIEQFNTVIETDNISTIKELVAVNLGVTIMAHSACRKEELSGQLMVIPIENMSMPREINIVYRQDFSHTEILQEILEIYEGNKLQM